MEFEPQISPTLRVMDERLFRPEPVGIKLESW
jgi:acyl CoA:acetate/3-ketoacid CoA transferase